METQLHPKATPFSLSQLDLYFDLDDALLVDTNSNTDESISDIFESAIIRPSMVPQLTAHDPGHQTTCAICMEGFDPSLSTGEYGNDNDLYGTHCLLPCSHAYHISCISEWLYAHTSCPLCRQSVLGRK
ncbi:unnamed protein product [Rhodiola kirilowii]